MHLVGQQSFLLNLLFFNLQIFTSVSVEKQTREGRLAQVLPGSSGEDVKGLLQLLLLDIVELQSSEAVNSQLLTVKGFREIFLSFLCLQNENLFSPASDHLLQSVDFHLFENCYF